MNMLYVTANTNAMDNNYDLSSFESQELKAVAGQSVKYDIAASGEVGADIISYNSDNLPEGLTLSVGGLLTGSIKQVGSYTFTVEMVADNWVTKSVDFKIEVAPVIIATGSELNATVTVGTEINTTFACSTVTEDSSLQNVTSKVIGDLPTGLTYDAETGKLSGTVTTAGVYNFTVRYSGEKQTAGGYWGRPTITEYTYDAVYTLIVEELPQEPVDYKVEVRVENGMVQYKNESGEWIDLIEVSKLNTPANDSNTGNNSILSGCIGTVSSATVVGLVTLAGAFLVAKRKEENK